jgi:hypothetical protein
MTRITLLTLLASAAIGGTLMAATGPGHEHHDSDLTEVTANRTALPTVDCVRIRDLGGNRTVGDAIVFGGNRRRIYINHPPGGCPDLRSGRSLTFRTTQSQLCRGDIVTVVDLVSGTSFGGCGLGGFTPYDRTN